MIPPPPRSSLLPYTTLFRSQGLLLVAQNQLDRGRIDVTRALGLDPATPVAFTDSLAPSLGAADVPVRRDSAVSAALTNRPEDRKSTRLNSSHSQISYAAFCL